MRMIEQVSPMLAAIISPRRAGRPEVAVRELEALCLQTVGLPMTTVRRSPPEALMENLAQSGGARYARAVLLAELLLQDAGLNQAANRPAEALFSQLQAFCLLAQSMDALTRAEAAQYQPRLEALATELEAVSDDPYLQDKIHAYRARTTGSHHGQ